MKKERNLLVSVGNTTEGNIIIDEYLKDGYVPISIASSESSLSARKIYILFKG